MQLPMVPTAKRHRKLITDLQTDGARLGRPEMVRITGLAPANQAWLRRHKLQVGFVTQSLRFGNDKLALVDPSCRHVGRARHKWRSQRHSVGRFIAQLVCQWSVLATAVISGRSWNRGRVIGMKAKAHPVCRRRGRHSVFRIDDGLVPP